MTALEELGLLLRPAGGGVHLVSSGRDAQSAAQRRLHRAGSDEEVEARFRERLSRIGTARAVLLGVPSDVGAGFLRGANQGPLALRTRLLEEDPELAGARRGERTPRSGRRVRRPAAPPRRHALAGAARGLAPRPLPGAAARRGRTAAGLPPLHRRAGPRPRLLLEPARRAGAPRGRPLHRLARRGRPPPGPRRVRGGAGRRPHRPARGATGSEVLLRHLVLPRERAARARRAHGPGGDPDVAPRSLPLGVDSGRAPDLGRRGAAPTRPRPSTRWSRPSGRRARRASTSRTTSTAPTRPGWTRRAPPRREGSTPTSWWSSSGGWGARWGSSAAT